MATLRNLALDPVRCPGGQGGGESADEFHVDGADLADGLGELGVGALALARTR